MGSGFPPSPENDDWSCAAFLFWMPGVLVFFAKLSERKGAEYADLKGFLQLLTSSHLRERDKMLLRAILCGGVWNGFLASSVAKGWGRALIFGSALSPSLQHVRELPEFASLMSLDRSKWPRCLLWHGWLPGLCDISDGDPWLPLLGI